MTLAATSKQRPPAKATDSDSDPEPTSRSLLRMRSGKTSQAGSTQPALATAQPKQVAAPSSDSDDELVRAVRPKQLPIPSAKQAAQSATAHIHRATVQSDTSRVIVPTMKGASHANVADRRTSRDKTSVGVSSLVTQSSLQRSAATGSASAKSNATGATPKPADTSEADSDDEQWKRLSARAVKPKLQTKVRSHPVRLRHLELS